MSNHFLSRHLIIVRFIVAGGTAMLVNLLALYLCTEYIGFHYLFSASIAFIISFVVSFILQKYWTFEDTAVAVLRRQAPLYFAVSVANYFLNLMLLYVFVEHLDMWYLLAQIIICGGIGCSSFLIYRHFIFTKNKMTAL